VYSTLMFGPSQAFTPVHSSTSFALHRGVSEPLTGDDSRKHLTRWKTFEGMAVYEHLPVMHMHLSNILVIQTCHVSPATHALYSLLGYPDLCSG
jgi:hypothetical protein